MAIVHQLEIDGVGLKLEHLEATLTRAREAGFSAKASVTILQGSTDYRGDPGYFRITIKGQ